MERGISDVVREVGISAHTLRYYDRIGLIVDVPRDAAGHRRYGDDDVAWLGFRGQQNLAASEFYPVTSG